MSEAVPAVEPEVLVQRHGSIALIMFNRPEDRNPISLTLGSNLLSALDEVDRDESVTAVVLSGVGRVFCAGGKLGEVLGTSSASARDRYRAFNDIVKATSRLRSMELPVICALNGPAVGGGAALALACDLVIAAEEASFVFAFGRVGASAADMGCAYLLPRIVGAARARHLLLTGAEVNAARGKEIGLVLEVVPRTALIEAAFELARTVAASAPRQALGATKAVLMRGETTDFETCLFYELYLQSYFLNSDEHKLRVAEFLQAKRRDRPAGLDRP